MPNLCVKLPFLSLSFLISSASFTFPCSCFSLYELYFLNLFSHMTRSSLRISCHSLSYSVASSRSCFSLIFRSLIRAVLSFFYSNCFFSCSFTVLNCSFFSFIRDVLIQLSFDSFNSYSITTLRLLISVSYVEF